MMWTTRRAAIAAILIGGTLGASAASAQSGPKVGAPAPAFTAQDSNGKPVSLVDLKGKTVVLEWTNDGCPFVRKHYGSQNMQNLQAKWTKAGIVWLSVISSAPGEQGFATGPRANELTNERGAAPTAVLLDPDGKLGHQYAAQTTPHMYVIKPDGMLAFMGGIDDKPSTRAEDVKGARNYVDEALTDLAQGKPIAVTAARPYGCTVKYQS